MLLSFTAFTLGRNMFRENKFTGNTHISPKNVCNCITRFTLGVISVSNTIHAWFYSLCGFQYSHQIFFNRKLDIELAVAFIVVYF